jgi:hypothetical protein
VNERIPLLLAGKLTVVSLVVAAVGVVIQIVSGADYPRVPPVFFILLIPAGLLAFGHWRWTPVLAVLAGLSLTFGLFASGESPRLFDPSRLGDSVGLWVQINSARRRRRWHYGNGSQLPDAHVGRKVLRRSEAQMMAARSVKGDCQE